MTKRIIRLSIECFIGLLISVMLLTRVIDPLKYLYIALCSTSIALSACLICLDKLSIVSELALFILASGSAVYSYAYDSLDLVYGSLACLLLADIILRHPDYWGTFILIAGLSCIFTPESTLFLILLSIIYILTKILVYDIIDFIKRHLTAILIFGLVFIESAAIITLSLFFEAHSLILYCLQLTICLEVAYNLLKRKENKYEVCELQAEG